MPQEKIWIPPWELGGKQKVYTNWYNVRRHLNYSGVTFIIIIIEAQNNISTGRKSGYCDTHNWSECSE